MFKIEDEDKKKKIEIATKSKKVNYPLISKYISFNEKDDTSVKKMIKYFKLDPFNYPYLIHRLTVKSLCYYLREYQNDYDRLELMFCYDKKLLLTFIGLIKNRKISKRLYEKYFYAPEKKV